MNNFVHPFIHLHHQLIREHYLKRLYKQMTVVKPVQMFVRLTEYAQYCICKCRFLLIDFDIKVKMTEGDSLHFSSKTFRSSSTQFQFCE